MGQYYRPIFLNEKNKPITSLRCYDFGSGAKLMEHSWMLNPFVRFVEHHLMLTPQRLVWAGDYADGENGSTLSDYEISLLLGHNTNMTKEDILKESPNLYTLSQYVGITTHDEDVKDKYSHDFKTIAPLKAKYLINHDKKEFVNKTKVPKGGDGWRIHPLPLLTCEGNGRGGGDFRGESDLIGAWARNLIEVSTKKSVIPKGYKEIIFDLVE